MSTEIKEQTKPKIYVWAKTERAGDVVTVDKTEGEFTLFTDGTKIFSSIIDEVLMEARDDANAKSISKDFKIASAPVVDTAPEPIIETKTNSETGEINVMLEMLKKISAKNTISMPLNLNVPSKEVYELFKDQMDITKADLNDHILALVLSQIDNLQEQLKPQAEEFIKNYYNGKTKRTKINSGGNTTGSGSDSSAPDITY